MKTLDIKTISTILSLDESFFLKKKFVSDKLIIMNQDTKILQVGSTENYDNKLSKIIFSDDEYFYKLYFSIDNYNLQDTIFLIKNNIIDNFIPECNFIINNNNEIIGIKIKRITIFNNNLENKMKKEITSFYESFFKTCKKKDIIFYDVYINNIGFEIINGKPKIYLFDIDCFISNSHFVSNIESEWHNRKGIIKYKEILEKYKLLNYYEI
jgi:hypothetical protein